MNDYPQTIEEAREYRYNRWGGNPKGSPYREGKCAGEVFLHHLFYQCSRSPKYGPGNLYCKTHAKYAERCLSHGEDPATVKTSNPKD